MSRYLAIGAPALLASCGGTFSPDLGDTAQDSSEGETSTESADEIGDSSTADTESSGEASTETATTDGADDCGFFEGWENSGVTENGWTNSAGDVDWLWIANDTTWGDPNYAFEGDGLAFVEIVGGSYADAILQRDFFVDEAATIKFQYGSFTGVYGFTKVRVNGVEVVDAPYNNGSWSEVEFDLPAGGASVEFIFECTPPFCGYAQRSPNGRLRLDNIEVVCPR